MTASRPAWIARIAETVGRRRRFGRGASDTAPLSVAEALARTAEGSPTAFQGKAASTDGPVRYTAPSLVFERGDIRLEAGGFQPIEAYDVVIANIDPTLKRRPAPDNPLEALDEAPLGLVTAEVAEPSMLSTPPLMMVGPV